VKRFFVAALLISVGLALACDDELSPPTTGSTELNIILIPDTVSRSGPTVQRAARDEGEGEAAADSARHDYPRGLSASSVDVALSLGALGFTSVRARAEGPTNRTVSLTLVDGFWEGELTGLQPGAYTVIIEAFVDGELDARAVSGSVTVTAGATSTATVTLGQGSFRPTLNAIAAPGTRMNFAVSWSAVTAATGYRVEWSKSSVFTGRNLDSTSTVVAVSDTGTWNVRVRATLSGVTGGPSEPVTVAVNAEAPGTSGENAATAAPLGFGAAATGTLTQLNIAPAADQDWFGLDACFEDVLVVQTRAATLTPASPLNTRLRLYNDDGTQLLAENDDDGVTTDSRLQFTVQLDGRYNIQVTGVGGTTGHYELDVVVQPGANNPGTPPCVQPTVGTVVVTPAAVTLDALGLTQQLTAEARDGAGAVIPGVTLTWSSSDSTVATVDGTGLVTSVNNGVATVTATAPGALAAAEEVVPEAAPEDATGRDVVVEEDKVGRGRGRLAEDRGRKPGVTRAAAQPPSGSATVTVQQAPATLTISPPQDTTKFLGSTAQFTGEVFDPLGSAIAGAAITWSSDNPGVATVVDSTGLATAVSPGTANIMATHDTVANSVELVVIQEATAITRIAGDNQTGFTGTTLPESLAVQVQDAGGSPIQGVSVDWTVTTGGGAVSAATTMTDGNGETRVAWTLGGNAGAQNVDAVAAGLSATFAANAIAGIQWANAANGNWSDPANWVGGVVPGTTDNVLIGLDGDYTVTMDVDPTVAFLQLGALTGTQQLLGSAVTTLTVNGTLAITGGGQLFPAGGSVVADTISNSGSIFLAGDLTVAVLTNNGQISASVGSIDFSVSFDNFDLIFLNDGAFVGLFTGAFTNQAGGTLVLGLNATLDLTLASATFAGGLTVDSSRTVFMDGVAATVTGGAFILPDGTLDLTNATLTVDTLDNAGNLFLNGSAVTGPLANRGFLAAFTGSNTLDGQITTLPSSAISVDGGATTLLVTSSFTNNGNISFTGVFVPGAAAGLSITSPGILTNNGTIDFQDIPIDVGADVVNQGNINVSAAGTPVIVGSLTNTGTGDVFIEGGDFQVLGNLTNGATITIGSGRQLSMPTPGTTFDNSGIVQGSGTLDVSSATFTSSGIIAPGGSPGVFTIIGDVTLTGGETRQRVERRRDDDDGHARREREIVRGVRGPQEPAAAQIEARRVAERARQRPEGQHLEGIIVGWHEHAVGEHIERTSQV